MKIKYMFLLAFVVCCASCQNKPTIENEPIGGVAPLEISVGTKALSRTPIIGKWFTHGSQINVILLDKGATSSYNVMAPYQIDRPDEKVEGTWVTAELTTPLVVKSDVARVLAHYPATENIILSANKQTITPTSANILDLGENNVSTSYESFQMAFNSAKPTELTEIFSAKADIDYMTGVGNDVSLQTPSGTKATMITMQHAKAMVVVRLFKEDGYQGDDQLKSITISNTNIGSKPLREGSFNIATNAFTPTNPINYSRSMSKFPGGTSFSMMVFPATIAEDDVTIEFHVAMSRYTLPLKAKTWEAGKVYAYNVQLSAAGVELIGGVMIYDWPESKKLIVDLE